MQHESSLWKRQVLLKLLSLQLPIWKREYDDQMLREFVNRSASYQHTLDDVLKKQFPETTAEARNMFRIQFSTYCNSLFVLEHLPDSMVQEMIDRKVFDDIPGGQEICFQGLMLLSTIMD